VFGKVMAAAVVMGIAAWLANDILVGRWPAAHLSVRVARLAVSITVALAVLVASAKVLRIKEFDEALGAIGVPLKP
jgi:peptidoglycan biosynthesis protein MviN/MurJ (putative lipid II flippase)